MTFTQIETTPDEVSESEDDISKFIIELAAALAPTPVISKGWKPPEA